MPEDYGRSTIPAWDGAARGWRRYTREVAWYVQSTAPHKRRHVAATLISKLTGPARLLAMSWPMTMFDQEDGTRVFLQRLARSPLVRKSLPNAAAICQQYFSFKRSAGESIGNFLVRETLVHEEFVEAIHRLYEEQHGIAQDQRDFGLPPAERRDSWWYDESSWYEDDEQPDEHGREEGDVGEGSPEGEGPATRPDGGATPANADAGTRASAGSSPSRRSVEPEAQEVVAAAPGPLDELSIADSFLLGVLRGWRLLQAAGLSAEEKRDILSTSKNSLEYEVIAAALQTLWDEQLLGHRGSPHAGGQFHANFIDHKDEDHMHYQNAMDEWWYEDDWWYDDAYVENDWWSDQDWQTGNHDGMQALEESPDPEHQEKLREAQQAEKVAESLAMEAQRTWSDAQKVTQALRRDRGFGSPSNSTGHGLRCYNCGGQHLARECPDRRHAGMDDEYQYYIGKGKGKNKGKRGMWMEGQFMSNKGKGKFKTKSKDGNRSVNAYMAQDFFVGGMELRDSKELHSVSASEPPKPEVGMLDCGATASAAPEAAVQSLLSAIVAQDRSAKIELDQSSRPYFRFGNGKWGRALCKVTIRSSLSGSERSFSLYTLPNPAEYYQSGFDKNSLVPILIGMDFLGPLGVGMLVDFSTGLYMLSKDPEPEIFQLNVNRKGHYTLDIVQYLTKGLRCLDGQAHVIVREATSSDCPHMSQQVLELGTAWIDLTVSDAELHNRELEASRNRLWVMYRRSRPSTVSNAEAQMNCATGAQVFSSTSPPSSSPCDGSPFERSPGDRPRDRADPHGGGQSEESRQAETEVTGHNAKDQSRPTGSSLPEGSMALLRNASAGTTAGQSVGSMDPLQLLRPSSSVHPQKGVTFEHNHDCEPRDGEADAQRVAADLGDHQADSDGVPPHDEQDHGRGCPESVHRGAAQPGCAGHLHRDDRRLPLSDQHHMGSSHGPGRRGTGGSVRERSNRGGVIYKPKVEHLPLYMGKRLMAMVTMMTATMTAHLVDLQLTGRDGLWEVACAPHSWLSEAAEQHGLRPRRINLASGYDLYKEETWQRLRVLRRQHQPQRVWFSLPCTKWCSWTSVNYNTPERQAQLETARRKERRLLWEVNNFIKDCLEDNDCTKFYFEWPYPCFGWKQAPMEDLARYLEEHGHSWLQCRIDGCNYGMKNEASDQFIQKKWLIRTNDEVFHRAFRAKVCPGNHGQHASIQGAETARTAYYPWKMVQSIARHWRDQFAPGRHQHLLSLKHDLPALHDEEIEVEETEEFLDELKETSDMVIEDYEVATTSADKIALEHMAREARMRGNWSLEHLGTILREVPKCVKVRQAVREHGRGTMSGATSLILGGYSHGAQEGITKITSEVPELIQYVNAVLHHYAPQETWTTVMLNFNVQTRPHKDHHNLKGSSNILLCVGNFSGGGLWIQQEPQGGETRVRRRLPDGSLPGGVVKETCHRVVIFDPTTTHATQQWKGERIGISAYTTRMIHKMSDARREELRQYGFPLPKMTDDHVVLGAEVKDNKVQDPLGIPPDVSKDEVEAWRAKISKIHRAAGHPTNKNLARIVRDGGHDEWKVQVALHHRCDACDALKAGSVSSGKIPPASVTPAYKAWQAVTADVGEWYIPGTKKKAKFILFMDMATKLRVIQPLMIYEVMAMQSESTEEVIQAFSERRLGQYPKPAFIILDAAYSFASERMHDFLASVNIQPHFVADKESWAHGTAEAAVQDVKRTATAIHLDALDQHPFVSLQLTVASLNSTEYTAGYSAFQWAFGKNYDITDEDVRTFNSIPHDGQEEYTKLVTNRQKAEAIALKTRSQRILSKLTNSTVRQPLRTFKEMDLVKIWRKVWPLDVHQGPKGGFKVSGRPHWIGPGRVVFHEVLPQQDQGDHRRHIVWVLIGSRLYRCSVHSVRPATEAEKFVYETSDREDFARWKSLADIVPQREYTDLMDEEPLETDRELPELPAQPDDTTVVKPSRRIVGKKSPTTIDQEEEQGTSSSSTTKANVSSTTKNPAVVEVNDYDDTAAKRSRKEDNWVEALCTEAAREAEFDLFNAMDETHDFLKIEFNLEAPKSNRERKQLERNPQAYMVKKMRDSEVVLTKLNPAERKLFGRAKAKEVDSFVKHEAVRKCLDDREVRQAYETNRIVKARWVLTWKLVPPEDREEAIQDANTNDNTVHKKDGMKKAKARIVLLGFQHPSLLDPNFKTASPVQSTLGRNLLYTMSAQHQWMLEGLDLATAFLQTQPTEADQELWTSGVQELREALGIGEEAIMRVLRNIYGSTTAPRGLWLDLHKTLTKLGATPVMGERCLWRWTSKDRKDRDHKLTIGAMGGHVDDFHRIGDGSEEWLAIKASIDKACKWGMTKQGTYRHAGTDVSTTTDENGFLRISVNQDYYVEALPDLDISPNRLRTEAPLERKDMEACRASLGALQWLAVQSQPQLCARCNLLLTELVVNGSMSTAREIQEMIGEVRREPFRLTFQRFPSVKHWTDLVFVSMGDQAHNNRPKGDSTGGYITLVSGPECDTGVVCAMNAIAWRTWKLKRKSISSNDAEVQAALEAEDNNFRARLLWSELHAAGDLDYEQLQRKDPVDATERQVLCVKGIVCTDSKGGYDAVELNESPLLGLSNMRSALQAFQLRGNLARAAGVLRWVASDYDLGDALTKKRADCRLGLIKFLRSGHWCIKYDPAFTSAKKAKQQGRTAVDTVNQHLYRKNESSLTSFGAGATDMPLSDVSWEHVGLLLNF